MDGSRESTSSARGKTLLRGHGLLYEGSAFDYRGQVTFDRVGFAKCWCGAMSEELSSNKARQRWHREHKQQIREAQS